MGSTRLGFLSIFVLLLGLAALAWIAYFCLKHYRKREELPPPPSPSKLWMTALTHYPGWFLAISVGIPFLLSWMGLARTAYSIRMNLDFDTYLQIDSELDSIAQNYDAARRFQARSAFYDNTCKDTYNRDLQVIPQVEYDNVGEGDWITITYQNRNGGNVFVPEVLQEIYDFEQSIQSFPGWQENCHRIFQGRPCAPLDSLASRFFQNGYMVSNTQDVVQSFLRSPQDIWKVDQYFGPQNLQSNITKTRVLLRRVRRGDEAELYPFMERIYHELFYKTQFGKSPYKYVIITWDNNYLLELEKNEALTHDTLWSIGSLLFIALMILCKVQDAFVVFFAMLGLLLAFSTSYYWCLSHFDINDISLLHVSGLFVMLGIGADDIFLMIDSYDHAESELLLEDAAKEEQQQLRLNSTKDEENEEQNISLEEKEPPKASPRLQSIRQRMVWAYHTAGSMMLVSSTTTAVCFFSNAFGVIVVVQELGIFMGMVVLCNYLHVMTILPSAILVNEIYFKPWRQGWMAKRQESQQTDEASGQPEAAAVTGEQDEEQDATTDAKDLDDKQSSKDNMNRIDRFLTERYTPFVTKRRRWILSASVVFSILMACLGVLNFEAADGTIVLFSKKYNFGRLTIITDTYYNDHLKKTIVEQDSPPSPTLPPSTPAPSTSLAPSNAPLDVEENEDGITYVASFGGSNPAPAPRPGQQYTPPPVQQQSTSSGSNSGSSTFGSSSSYSTDGENSGGGTNGGASNIFVPTEPTLQVIRDDGSVVKVDNLQRRETIWVDLVWGIQATRFSSIWLVKDQEDEEGEDRNQGTGRALQTTFTVIDFSDFDVITDAPSSSPNATDTPSTNLTDIPSTLPSDSPSSSPTPAPTASNAPSAYPTTDVPSAAPTDVPSRTPSVAPSAAPTTPAPTVPISHLQGVNPKFDLSDPGTQQWLFDVVQYARQDKELNVRAKSQTWIEELRELAIEEGIGFPMPGPLFLRYAEELKCRNNKDLRDGGIGTAGKGFQGDVLFASITLRADVVRTGDSLSLSAFKNWERFANKMNGLAPPGMVPVVAQSSIFWNGYRTEQTVNSTITTWLIANGLCFVIILLFTQNLLICLMVLVTLLLIFLCITGWLFAVFGLQFGPVQALGVSIFIGLSANYSLHAAHAYHRARGENREEKVQQAVFITGSPICASAFSTLGGTVFLFACRTSALVELGILIFCVTGMALVYSMGFLLSLLLMIGPLPYETGKDNQSNHQMQQCDIYTLCYIFSRRRTAGVEEKIHMGSAINEDTTEEIPASKIAAGSLDRAGQTEVELAMLSPTDKEAKESGRDEATAKEPSEVNEVGVELASILTGDQVHA